MQRNAFPDAPTAFGYDEHRNVDPARSFVPGAAEWYDSPGDYWPQTDYDDSDGWHESPTQDWDDWSEAQDPAPFADPAPAEPGRVASHRKDTTVNRARGRAVIAAVAAGAAVAATQAGLQTSDSQPVLMASSVGNGAGAIDGLPPAALNGTDAHFPEILNSAPVEDLSQFQDILQNGQQFAEDLAAREASKFRPIFAKFASGTFTSGFGSRWGVEHLGVDVAAPIGTPIYAIEDGTVISAGPAEGFGMWVRLQHDDGTITVYGHVDTATVSVGQRVLAGDQIATVGNRGFSTGPHCHFEVWLNGSDKIDPLPWLASRGISLGPEED
ncbi:M23 family metallopeptidase [Nocardia sp. NBC_00511]|uniref:M23 family metallopeptidase n=1 Tax=Nocardia sp. NBC_00511 TaxID=2903591 RepID=UPI0030E336F2